MGRSLAVILGLAFISQASMAIDPAKLRSWIAYFKARDPVADATKDHQDGKTQVISAMGAGGEYYPGIKNRENGDTLAKKHGLAHLPATSDAIESKLHREYMDIATDYASKYNETTLKLLGVPNS